MTLRLFTVLCAFALTSASARATEPGPEDVSKRVGPSVVRIADMVNGEESGQGTGFLVADGIVVTNHHVIAEVDGDLVAVFADGKRVRVLGKLADDEVHDLALLRIEGKGYPVLQLAPSSEVIIGERVTVVGSPLGFDQTVSSGIISAIRDSYPAEWKKRDAKLIDQLGPLIQHTAATAPGASGSPLVDDQSRVVGVHHSAFDGTEIHFAAHVDALRALIVSTDLTRAPAPLGPNVRRNLLISAAVVGVIVLAWLITMRVLARRRRRVRH
jgi:S1-C subfamily serine protease